jgi:hypothetical protein
MTLSGELPPIAGDVLFNGEPTAPLHKRGGQAWPWSPRSVRCSWACRRSTTCGSAVDTTALERFLELGERLEGAAGLLSRW